MSGALLVMSPEAGVAPGAQTDATLGGLAVIAAALLDDSATGGQRNGKISLKHLGHDFRTPLGIILGYAQLFDTSTLSVQQKEDFATIEQAAHRLLAHLDHLRKELQ